MEAKIRHLCCLAAAGLLLSTGLAPGTQAASDEAGDTEQAAVAEQAPVSGEAGVSEETLQKGQELFVVNCRQCHGTKGTAGAPLKGNDNLEDPDFVVTTILTGPGYMTGFADHLDDEQIALLATFVRNSWGNGYGPVSPEAVAGLR